MDEPLPDGGMIRKLWIGETDAYRDHLLRLDRESRNRRFSGAVSDDFVVQHAASAGKRASYCTAFLSMVFCAARRNCAPLDRFLLAQEKRLSASSSPGKVMALARCCSNGPF